MKLLPKLLTMPVSSVESLFHPYRGRGISLFPSLVALVSLSLDAARIFNLLPSCDRHSFCIRFPFSNAFVCYSCFSSRSGSSDVYCRRNGGRSHHWARAQGAERSEAFEAIPAATVTVAPLMHASAGQRATCPWKPSELSEDHLSLSLSLFLFSDRNSRPLREAGSSTSTEGRLSARLSSSTSSSTCSACGPLFEEKDEKENREDEQYERKELEPNERARDLKGSLKAKIVDSVWKDLLLLAAPTAFSTYLHSLSMSYPWFLLLPFKTSISYTLPLCCFSSVRMGQTEALYLYFSPTGFCRPL